MRNYFCLLAILTGIAIAPPLAAADEAQCPFFKPDCCSKGDSECNLPQGCSCSDFEATTPAKNGQRKFARRAGVMSKRGTLLPSNLTGTWRVTGSVPSSEPQCRTVCSGRPIRCIRTCGPTPPPTNTCSFVVTSRTFNVVARETSRGITAKVDDKITLSGSRNSASSATMAGSGYYSELDRKSTRLNSSHTDISRMPSSA